MSRATARGCCFIATATYAGATANPHRWSFEVFLILSAVLWVVIFASARRGWRDVAACPDDSPLPPDVLDLGDKSKVGRKSS